MVRPPSRVTQVRLDLKTVADVIRFDRVAEAVLNKLDLTTAPANERA
jgi:hypothetical protein